MGAWIETFTNPNNVCGGQSHPTWVRGLKLFDFKTAIAWHIVAPHVGAWIETACLRSSLRWDMSHPTWVRGLKLFVSLVVPVDVGSHPTWVRGLKQKFQEVSGVPVRRTPRGCVD